MKYTTGALRKLITATIVLLPLGQPLYVQALEKPLHIINENRPDPFKMKPILMDIP
jgi:hypothetical protein